MRKGADQVRADGFQGKVKILTACPSCLQGLCRYDDDSGTSADYIVVEMARHLLGKDWMRGIRRQGQPGRDRACFALMGECALPDTPTHESGAARL